MHDRGIRSGADDRLKFDPIPALKRDNADISLIMIVNSVKSYTPIEDPVYASHQPRYFDSGDYNWTSYASDRPAGNIGCMEQVSTYKHAHAAALMHVFQVRVLHTECSWTSRLLQA